VAEMKHYLGIDCGSVSIKFALMRDGELIDKVYLRNRGLISVSYTHLTLPTKA